MDDLLRKYEAWIRLDIRAAQMTSYDRAGDAWRDADWTEELPSGQWDIWQTLDEAQRKDLCRE